MINFFSKLFASLCIVFFSISGFSWTINFISKVNISNIGEYFHIKAHKYKRFPTIIHMVLLKKSEYRSALLVQEKANVSSVMNVSIDARALVAINGGYYRENFLPNGLLIYHGHIYSHIVINHLLSGIVAINQAGEIVLLKRGASLKNIDYAFQSGPILNDSGKLYQGSSNALRKRSVIVEFYNKDIVVISFSPVTLSDASNLIMGIANKLGKKIKLAINLDGGPASSFVVNFRYFPLIIPEYKPVKSVLLFQKK
jgi:hypothetical protein